MNEQNENKFPRRDSHDVSRFLDPIDWVVFGNVDFNHDESRSDNPFPRTRRFVGLMKSLSQFAGVKFDRLVFFQNNEFKPEDRFHHIHFLLARNNLEKFSPESVCEFLTTKSAEFGFGPCQFSPFDSTRDGVGYVTKKVYRRRPDGTAEVIPFDYHPSAGLVKLWNQLGFK
jgi:hypothetical protein